MNKKQLNTLSASLSKALSPPSRKKIELSARIIDQVQPLPGIVSRSMGSETNYRDFTGKVGKAEPGHSSAFHPSPARPASTNSRTDSLLESSPSTQTPAKTFLRQRIVRIQRIQDGLTMAEQRVLNYLWEKAEKEASTTSRVVTVSQKTVAFVTHLSVVSVRANLRSLESKLCIEETVSFDATEHVGRTYRVYSFAWILDRWRRSGYLWARQTRGVELVDSSHSSVAEESLAPENPCQDSSAAQVSLAPQVSSRPPYVSSHSSQDKDDDELLPVNSLTSHQDEDSSAPQFSLPPQGSSVNPQSLDSSRTCNSSKESLPPQGSLAPEDSCPPHASSSHSTTSTARQESLAPSDSLPFIKKENKQTKQSSTSATVSLSQFPETLQALAEFPATRLADDDIVSNMIRQVLINTPDASDAEIAYFVHHKGREIKNPKTSFMACLSAVVVGAMQGHRMALYRQQRQKERQRQEAEQRRKLDETVGYSKFWLNKLEQQLGGQTVDPSRLKDAIGFLRFHLPQLPATLQQRIRNTLQAFTEQ
jgi:hypothetical protein